MEDFQKESKSPCTQLSITLPGTLRISPLDSIEAMTFVVRSADGQRSRITCTFHIHESNIEVSQQSYCVIHSTVALGTLTVGTMLALESSVKEISRLLQRENTILECTITEAHHLT